MNTLRSDSMVHGTRYWCTECSLSQDLVSLLVTRRFQNEGIISHWGVLGRDGNQTTCMSSPVQQNSAFYKRFQKRFFLCVLLPLCHGCVDLQPRTPVSLRWCRVLCHQRESILLLMKQKMKRSLQLLITDCREPFIIVSRRNAGTPCLISSAWLWHYIS